MLGQIIAATKDLGERISNVVMMGIGEPLDNYDNVIRFLELVGCEDGLNIGYRHISLSTCGLADKIDEIADRDFPITLSISLHAYDDAIRSSIMPVNKKWNIDRLLASCKRYFAKTGRRISFEYTLISGKNDTREGALALAALLNSRLRSKNDTMPIHVNLIPLNPVAERDFTTVDRKNAEIFRDTLCRHGVNATIRRTLGPDINASCGQLRRQKAKQQ
jgi:23S rRNA (adenine2503-C2)-methyltransferase